MGQSPTSNRIYQMVTTASKQNRSALQTGSMTTSVIQTLQLQRNPNHTSGQNSGQTYVIKMNPNRLQMSQQNSVITQRPLQHSVNQCNNEPYAQCTFCKKLFKLDQIKQESNGFRCTYCSMELRR